MQHYPIVTIVGGSGFVGRHTVKLFADAGWRVRVLSRDIIAAEFIKTAGYPGQMVLDYADITKPATLEGKFAGSDAVVNLVGVMHGKFDAVQVKGARNVAEAAAKAGAKALVHVSALGIEDSSAKYAKTKLAGEQAVHAAFPQAVILRPSLVVGPEDHFFQRFARLSLIAPALPLIGGGKTRFQPVLVTDLAQAIFRGATYLSARGQTLSLAGPEIFTFRQMIVLLGNFTNRRICTLSLPSCFAALIGMFCELLPLPPMLTRDQVKLLKTDAVLPDGAAGFEALGLTPAPIQSALPAYLARYRKE